MSRACLPPAGLKITKLYGSNYTAGKKTSRSYDGTAFSTAVEFETPCESHLAGGKRSFIG